MGLGAGGDGREGYLLFLPIYDPDQHVGALYLHGHVISDRARGLQLPSDEDKEQTTDKELHITSQQRRDEAGNVAIKYAPLKEQADGTSRL